MHISFVRSVSMDAFKAIEIERMRLGGNERWREFYEQHESTSGGISWDDGTDSDRYTGEAGDEWKERLTCKVEGKEYVPGEKKPAAPPKPVRSNTGTPLSGTASRSDSPAQQGSKVKVDDQYFAKLGADNASRPDHLPPNQGGKYAGFGSSGLMPTQSQSGLPGFDDVQKDPIAALTKGFGWFTTTVSKTAKTVNDGYIAPAAKNVRLLPSPFQQNPELTLDLHTVPRNRFRQTSATNSGPTRKASTGSWKECTGGLQPVCRGQREPPEECTVG